MRITKALLHRIFMTTKKSGRPRTRPATAICQYHNCKREFAIAGINKPITKFCSRECYRNSLRNWNDTPYPQVWHEGKRIYVHRLIFMEAHPEIELTSDDIIHHKDENPYNRHPDNLELIRGEEARLEHLAKHNFHRDKRKRKNPDDVSDPDCPF